MEDEERLKLEVFVEELQKYKGSHTELVSVYVPTGYNLNVISKQLEQEKSTAQNIKSKTTRKNVLDALERIVRSFKLYKKTPKNGLAIFCGNISKAEGQIRIELFSIEPPFPLKTKVYRCDQQFLVDPLKEMLEARDVYGLLVLDRKEATLGLLEGKDIKLLRRLSSGVPGKMRAGGQSSQRFKRLTENLAKEFYRRVSEATKDEFFGLKKLKGLLLGGPGPTKEQFLKEGQLVTALRNKIIATKDIGYADEHGLKLLVEASSDVLIEESITKEKKLLNKFFTSLANQPNKTIYDPEKIKKALEAGAVESLLISTTIKKSIIDEFKKAAIKIGATLSLVSTQTQEGLQFKNLGGIGAFLRFAIG